MNRATTFLLLLGACTMLLAAPPTPAAAKTATPSAPRSNEGIQNPEDLFAYIHGLYGRGYHGLALEQTELFRQHYPKHRHALDVDIIRIHCLQVRKKVPESIAAMREFLERHPKAPQCETYRQFLANMLFEKQDFQGAAIYFQPLLKSRDEAIREEAEYNLARCLFQLGRADEARPHIEALAKLPPRTDRLPRLHARVFQALDLQAAGKHREAIRIFLSLLALDSLPPALREEILTRAAFIAYNDLREYKLAVNFSGKLTAEFPSSTGVQQVRRIFLLCKYQLKEYEVFLQATEEYRSKFPKEAQGDLTLDWQCAQACIELKRENDAIPFLTRLIASKEFPPNLRQTAMRQLFSCRIAAGQDQAALRDGEAYLSDFPNTVDRPQILLALAAAAERLKDLPKAVEYYRQVLELLVETPEAYQATGLHLAALLQQQKQWHAAAEVLARIAATTTPDQRALRLLQASTCEAQIPDWPRARQHAEQVAAENTDNHDLKAKALACLYSYAIAQQNHHEAMARARQLVEVTVHADHANWLNILAALQMEQKDYGKAADTLQKLIRFPETPPDLLKKALPVTVQLLLYLRKHDDALQLAPRLLGQNTPVSLQILQILGTIAEQHQEKGLAASAWRRLVEAPGEVPAPLRDNARLHLAFCIVNTHPQEAREQLRRLDEARQRRSASPLPDADALAAELDAAARDFDAALFQADRALTHAAEATFPDTIERAQWIKARILYERDHDLDGAFKMTTLVFINGKTPQYIRQALALAAKICREQHRDTQAQELENELQRRFP